VSKHVRLELLYKKNNPYADTLDRVLNMVPEYPILQDYINNNPTNPTHPI